MAARLVAWITLALVTAGCSAPAAEGPDGPAGPQAGLLPSTWYPEEGVEWANLTGSIAAGSCVAVDAPVAPPVILAWWLRASPNATLLIRNFTAHRPLESVCFAPESEDVRTIHDVRRENWSEVLASGSPGYEFAMACDAPTPCEVHWWTQRIRQVEGPGGERTWAAPIGPPGAEYGG